MVRLLNISRFVMMPSCTGHKLKNIMTIISNGAKFTLNNPNSNILKHSHSQNKLSLNLHHHSGNQHNPSVIRKTVPTMDQGNHVPNHSILSHNQQTYFWNQQAHFSAQNSLSPNQHNLFSNQLNLSVNHQNFILDQTNHFCQRNQLMNHETTLSDLDKDTTKLKLLAPHKVNLTKSTTTLTKYIDFTRSVSTFKNNCLINTDKTIFNLLSLNCQSLKNKTEKILDYLYESNTDIAMLQETWLAKGDSNVYSQIKEYGFKLHHWERDGSRGGGLLTIYKPSINLINLSKLNTESEHTTFESINTSFVLEKKRINLINLYRPPYSKKFPHTAATFLDEFESFLSLLAQRKGIMIICGDFNINFLDTQNTYTKRTVELLHRFNLKQSVNSPTHLQGGLIDLVLIEDDPTTHKVQTEVCSDFHTDHYAIKLRFLRERYQTKPTIITKEVRDYKNLDIKEMYKDIQHSLLTNQEYFSTLSSTDAANLYHNILSQIYNKHCPITIKKYRIDRKRPCWYDSTLQVLKQNKRQAERKYKKHNTDENKENFKEQKKKYNKQLKLSRTEYNVSQINSSLGNPKRLFKILGNLSGTTKQNILPTFGTDLEVAEEFSEYFTNKINKIRNLITKENHTKYNMEHGYAKTQFENFNIINEEDMKAVISSLNNKSSQLDPIPTTLLINFVDLIYPIITHIVNSTISTSIFPSNLKHAEIKPQIKDNSQNSNDLKQFRPLSRIPYMSKVIEKVMHQQLDEYIMNHCLHAKYQSGYKKFNSCETAMIHVIDDIQKLLNQGNYVALLILDMSSAFDTVDHDILYEKLRRNFYLGRSAVNLIQSYLKNRTFSVNIRESKSKPKLLSYGVPQGSLLGPLLYIIYTKEIEKIAQNYNLEIMMYADDSQLYFSFKKDTIHSTQENINKCLSKIKLWMCQNFLKMNVDKTKLMLFKPKSNTNLLLSINYNGANISPVDSITILGVKIGNNLDLTPFINKKIQACCFHLRNLINIKDNLPFKTKIIMVTNVIISKLDYCNAILSCCSKTAIKPLQVILNRAIRFIFGINKRTHITPYQKKLHILPIIFRIKFKLCLIAYRIFNQIAPSYLSDDFTTFEPTTSINLRIGRGRDMSMFKVDRITTTKAETLKQNIKKEWNSLPLHLRNIKSISTFKKNIKAHFFLQAFSNTN